MTDETRINRRHQTDDERLRDVRREVSDQLQFTRRLGFASAQSRVFEMLIEGRSLSRVLEVLCTVIEEFLPSSYCAIGLYDSARGVLRRGAAPSLPEDCWQGSDLLGVPESGRSSAKPQSAGDPILSLDLSEAPEFDGRTYLCGVLGLKRCWTRPILASDGATLGTLSIYSSDSREPDATEAALIESAAETARVAIGCFDLKRLAREHAEMYEAVAEATSDAILMLSVDGTVESGNHAAERLFGRPFTDLAGMRPAELFSQPGSPAAPIQLPAVAATGPAEFDALHRSGESVPVEVRGVGFPDSSDGRSILVVRDVTVQKSKEDRFEGRARELEQTIDRRTERLARSEAHNRQLYDFAPDLYVTISRRGRLNDVNETTLEVLGYSREEAIGIHIANWLSRDSREALPVWLSALENGRSVNNEACTLVKKNGDLLQTSINARVRFDGSGAIEEIWVALRDVSRRVALEQSLEESEKYAMTGRLAAGIAHEVNNPLQTILLHLSLVERALGPDFPETESWENIKTCVQRIRQVVGSLMDLHRVGRSRIDTVDLNELVDDALELVETRLQLNRIRLVVDCSASLPKLRLVPQHVYQIVLNLVLNATDAMRDGGTLEVRTRRRAGQAILEVGDTGPELGSAEIEQLFDPLFSSKLGHGGLGLFVTRSLVEDQGGRVEVESRSGKGNVVRVTLPHASLVRESSFPKPAAGG